MCDGEFCEGTPNENEGEHTRPMLRLVTQCAQAVQPCHHLWGNHSPS
jgi:hypothetical protein